MLRRVPDWRKVCRPRRERVLGRRRTEDPFVGRNVASRERRDAGLERDEDSLRPANAPVAGVENFPTEEDASAGDGREALVFDVEHTPEDRHPVEAGVRRLARLQNARDEFRFLGGGEHDDAGTTGDGGAFVRRDDDREEEDEGHRDERWEDLENETC